MGGVSSSSPSLNKKKLPPLRYVGDGARMWAA